MNKKLMIISILAVFTLLAISFASAINSNTEKTVRTKESPLFRIRIRKTIKEKIGDLMRRFVGERVFYLPFQWLRNRGFLSVRERLQQKPTNTPTITPCLSCATGPCYPSCDYPYNCKK